MSKQFSKAFLVLESKTVYEALFLGLKKRTLGEIVFNTSHSGYEQMITDPSYRGQILVTSCSQQGNYALSVLESDKAQAEAFCCLDIQNSKRDSAWIDFLYKNKVSILTGLDTRKLILELRDKGSLMACILQEKNKSEALTKGLKFIKDYQKTTRNYFKEVSVKKMKIIKGEKNNHKKIALIDYGCKKNIIRNLKKYCSEIAIFPYNSSFKEIKDYSPNGVLLSNGPGDPEKVEESVISCIREILKNKIFIFGICMGHQLLCRALGAKTYKLKFGHRGSNHPVKDFIKDKVYMTSQNHGYSVDIKSLASHIEKTHIHLNDRSLSGVRGKNFLSVQFHPEASPGPSEANYLFKYFMDEL